MTSAVPYSPPTYNSSSFNCPFCHAFSHMEWAQVRAVYLYKNAIKEVEGYRTSECGRCYKHAIWVNAVMIYPVVIAVDDPNDDLPDDVKKDYIEAAGILQRSPRGAGALLRLSLQKLVDSLEPGTDDLNKKIGSLVKKGLDVKIQKALDVVRVIGNEAVHPGQIDLNDSPQIVEQLFKMVNLIGQKMISEPREIEEMYSLLPTEKVAGIEARDKIKE